VKRPHFLAEDVDGTNQFVVLKHRYGERGSITAEFYGVDDKWMALSI